jgi:serine/threonine protein kinase
MERMRRIEQVTAAWSAATHFRPDRNNWVRFSKYVPGQRIQHCPPSLFQLEEICHQLDAAHSQGLVHGDIHPKNVVLGRDSHTHVIDWEPSLLQIRCGRCVWITTPGWRDVSDIKTHSVSTATDLLGVWRLATGSNEAFFLDPAWTYIKQRCLATAQPFATLHQLLQETPR